MSSGFLPPINLLGWIQEHKEKLRPPVNASPIYTLSEDFVIQIVGGPNKRTDYHVNETEEFFYQIEGDMLLKVVSNGEFKDVPIKQGELFLLPGNTPHSPQRFADTVGLVIERRRAPHHQDALQWYCVKCHEMIHREQFHVEGLDLGSALKPIMEKFYASEVLRTCKQCSHVNPVPV
eukprot:TRINITY_DN3729_c0_g1_i2.p1 TRINITY_DN3729_c0_g1~~TRINITY_DN3729_c0_g1_i2.p1  ORF type:complete len:193 (-),score=27.01 TRINITY_DN3729_c0_g1_i2:106-636(-)